MNRLFELGWLGIRSLIILPLIPFILFGWMVEFLFDELDK